MYKHAKEMCSLLHTSPRPLAAAAIRWRPEADLPGPGTAPGDVSLLFALLSPHQGVPGWLS